jgi:hypothetical protein
MPFLFRLLRLNVSFTLEQSVFQSEFSGLPFLLPSAVGFYIICTCREGGRLSLWKSFLNWVVS